MARAMRFLWLLVIQFIGNTYEGRLVLNSPYQRPTVIPGALLSEIDRRPC